MKDRFSNWKSTLNLTIVRSEINWCSCISNLIFSEPEENGLIPRICQTLFRKMQEEKDESTTFHTEASYLEIYNEKVRDLLQVRF